MSVSNLFSSGGIVLHKAGVLTPTGLAGLVNEQVELGTEHKAIRDFASIYHSQVMITAQAPVLSFGTTQVGTLLGMTDQAGTCITSDPTHPGLDAYLVKHDRCNARDLAAATRYRIGAGLLVPQQLTLNHNDIATMTAQAIAVGSSAAAPMVINHGIDIAALAAGNTLSDREAYGLVRQTIRGQNLSGVKSVQVDFGVSTVTESADGSIFPEWVSVGSVLAIVTITGLDPTWVSDTILPINGVQLTHDNTTLRAARYVEADAGTFRPPTANEHIAITVGGIGYVTTAASGSDEATPQNTTIQLVSIHDGVNTPLVIDTAATTLL